MHIYKILIVVGLLILGVVAFAADSTLVDSLFRGKKVTELEKEMTITDLENLIGCPTLHDTLGFEFANSTIEVLVYQRKYSIARFIFEKGSLTTWNFIVPLK